MKNDNLSTYPSPRDVRGGDYPRALYDFGAMMKPEKLSTEQLRHIEIALRELGQMCSWHQTANGHEYWQGVCRELKAMWDNGTTDGKPWTDPEPPIPDGYRRAVQGDEERADCILWSSPLGTWIHRKLRGTFTKHDRYAVPADRRPTDTEAQSLPFVMVRDYDDRLWQKARLVRVSEGSYTCLAASRRNFETWSQCRHLYPNETP